MNQIVNIARKELNDALRNRWLLAISLLFAVLAVGIAWFGAAASGQVGFSSIPATVASLASLATFLIPLISLLMAYDAIVGEDENGTLLLLLTYPVSRGQILLGKFLGQGLVLAVATLLGFGSAGLAIGLLVADVDMTLLTWALGRFMLSSILLGLVFLGFAYLLSSQVAEKSRAAGLALGLWFLFVLVFDLALLGVLVVSEGKFNPELLPWLLLFNPTDVYRLINLSGFEASGSATGIMTLGGDFAGSGWILWGVFAVWVALPLLLAYVVFRRRIV
ncbi:MAG: ABC transporter permease [Hahellaceae bacterium]|nr:ABC transporter permease [Hahellaceae bacterium]